MFESIVMPYLAVLHAGHGAESVSPLAHYLVEAHHALPLAAAIGVGILVAAVVRRKGRARP